MTAAIDPPVVTTLVYRIEPMGKPRQTRRDKWDPSPAARRYRAWADRVRALGIELPESGAHITFVIAMPASWRRAKRARHDGQPHRQRPDLDNCIKALADAIHSNDAHLWDYRVTKVWGEVGMVLVDQRHGTVAGQNNRGFA